VAGICLENGGLQTSSSGHRGSREKTGAAKEKLWMDIVNRDLQDVDITWEAAEELAVDKAG